jgi:uncharacterized protein YidB (DUF937 family)
MKPFETLKTSAAGIAEKITGENPKLMAETVKLIEGFPGGFTGFIKGFRDKGLGTLVPALDGKVPKQAILPEQVITGFGTDKIDMLAKATGLDPKIVPEKLAGILPKVFEHFASLVGAR